MDYVKRFFCNIIMATTLFLQFKLDINECSSNNGGCAHHCHNTHGNYYCSCNQGYQISWDDRSCAGMLNNNY